MQRRYGQLPRSLEGGTRAPEPELASASAHYSGCLIGFLPVDPATGAASRRASRSVEQLARRMMRGVGGAQPAGGRAG